MAWYDNVIKFSWTNILVAVGVAVMVPVLLPVVGYVVRPVAKGLVKGGLMIKDTVVGFASEAGEQVSDMVAEAEAEHYGKTS
ncbi:MAG: DUF5132 domain-containing protein [Thermodesulfobacteriota bacterium]